MRLVVTGVYSIMHIASRKRYIGSTTMSFGYRWRKHRELLERGEHHSIYLQNAWNRYGSKAFVFRVLKRCDRNEVLLWEQHFITRYNSTNGRGYNICPTAGNSHGRVITQQARDNMSRGQKGRKHSAATKAKMSASTTGKAFTSEHRANLSISHKQSPIFQAIMLERNKSEKQRTAIRTMNRTSEHVAKTAAWHRGRKRTGQALANIQAGNKRRVWRKDVQ